ncbi:MAG: DUF3775 domain-containing protein [Tistlia sp.]|uniref:DUF3775 domain-containing protein n=1 Tax=Tistlia sp. TaxID=3057121 RepID=UPI0034A3D247
MASLDIDPDKVCFVVARFRELEEEDLIEDPDATEEEDPDIDHEEAFDGLEGGEEELDPLREELEGFIEALPEDEQIVIVALAWLGRGDYDIEEWDDALEAAADQHNERTAGYLLGMPRLADFLEEGLVAFGLSCVDFDENRI